MPRGSADRTTMGETMAIDRHSIVDEIADRLLDRILSGAIKGGSALPPETEIAAEMNASRLTVREAIKVLQAHNIVQVRRGIGTFANLPEQWTSLDAIIRGVARGIGAEEIPLRLLEARQMVETGAAELAATRHQAAHITAMQESIDLMVARRDLEDVAAFTAADIAFHDAVLTASGNPFIPALLNSLAPLLYSTRRERRRFHKSGTTPSSTTDGANAGAREGCGTRGVIAARVARTTPTQHPYPMPADGARIRV
jgi:DNA-binding FadR family transcriptional regulator